MSNDKDRSPPVSQELGRLSCITVSPKAYGISIKLKVTASKFISLKELDDENISEYFCFIYLLITTDYRKLA